VKKENINIRVEETVKKEFFDTCKYLGIRPSVALRNFIQGINNLTLEKALQVFDSLYNITQEKTGIEISSKGK